jgi:hypothetical protein
LLVPKLFPDKGIFGQTPVRHSVLGAAAFKHVGFVDADFGGHEHFLLAEFRVNPPTLMRSPTCSVWTRSFANAEGPVWMVTVFPVLVLMVITGPGAMPGIGAASFNSTSFPATVVTASGL